MKKPLGIYIHLPFCLKKCLYCDFCSYVGVDGSLRERYVDALCRHISQYREICADHEVDTVYFGGGTPTLLATEQFSRIFKALHNNFSIAPDAEITVECNPATADLEKLRALRRLGVNRLSLGVQSANDDELAALGRVHRFADAVAAFSDARAAGFDNISVDLMFGIPNQTRESFSETLQKLLALSPDHVSAYGLILEEGTPFYTNSENLVLPDEDTEYTMYTDAWEAFESRGLSRYEISNFAASAFRSRHNLKYWHYDEYLGFGCSAHSLFGGKRFYCPAELGSYIAGEFIEGEEDTDPENEFVMLGMRLAEGVDESEFARRFGESFEECYGKALEPFVKKGLVLRKDGRTRFSDEGFYLSNAVLSEILTFDKFSESP